MCRAYNIHFYPTFRVSTPALSRGPALLPPRLSSLSTRGAPSRDIRCMCNSCTRARGACDLGLSRNSFTQGHLSRSALLGCACCRGRGAVRAHPAPHPTAAAEEGEVCGPQTWWAWACSELPLGPRAGCLLPTPLRVWPVSGSAPSAHPVCGGSGCQSDTRRVPVGGASGRFYPFFHWGQRIDKRVEKILKKRVRGLCARVCVCTRGPMRAHGCLRVVFTSQKTCSL